MRILFFQFSLPLGFGIATTFTEHTCSGGLLLGSSFFFLLKPSFQKNCSILASLHSSIMSNKNTSFCSWGFNLISKILNIAFLPFTFKEIVPLATLIFALLVARNG